MKRIPTDRERKSQERIIELINTECGGSQQMFADRVGIGKSSVSQYVNGRNYLPETRRHLSGGKTCLSAHDRRTA